MQRGNNKKNKVDKRNSKVKKIMMNRKKTLKKKIKQKIIKKE